MIRMYYVLSLVVYCTATLIDSEKEGRQFLERFDNEATIHFGEKVLANWNYFTNVTNENQIIMTNKTRNYSAFLDKESKNAAKYNRKSFKDPVVRRLFGRLVQISPYSDDKSRTELVRRIAVMLNLYHTARVCPADRKYCLMFDDSDSLLADEQNENTLLEMWLGWREASGRNLRFSFQEYVKLSNKAAELSGYTDISEVWQRKYESKTFEKDIKRVLLELQPLYEQLHSYVRRKLAVRYRRTSFPKSGHIPAHLVDHVWRHKWSDLYKLVKPYPNVTSLNVTRALVEKGYQVANLVKMAQDFYTSLSFEPMTEEFWAKSIVTKPENREMICEPSAFDFSNGKDFRMKMCANVTEKDVITILSQMGRIVYYMSYRHQPFLFRNGANPGFSEAMAGLSKLSFQTPEHFQILGLTSDIVGNTKSDINALMKTALETVAPLPFFYLVDKWRWGVFQYKTHGYELNKDWWKLRCKYEGISPPVKRTERDFDAGSEHHVARNRPYIQNFVGTILTFQWHKAICSNERRKKPLHRCDIFRNWEGGSKLKKMLEMGSSRPWPEVLKKLTGSEQMSAKPLIEYFQPLMDWLINKNKGQKIGWDDSCPDHNKSAASTMFQASGCYVLTLALAFVLTLC